VGPQPLLDGPVGEQVGGERPVPGDDPPRGGAGLPVPYVLHDDEGAVGAAAQGAGVGARLDHDLLQAGQGEEQGVVDGPQQPFGEVGGGRVAQREDDGGVIAVGGGALGGEGKPEQRDVPVAPPDLVTEAGAVPGGLGGMVTGLGEGPADTTVPADDGGLVGDGEDGREPDAEPPYGGRAGSGVPFGGSAEGGERLDTGGVQRGAGVGGDEDAVAQGQPQPPGDSRPRRRAFPVTS
jgi:hypothetical protein